MLGAFCVIPLSLYRIYNPVPRSGSSSLARAKEIRKPNQAWHTLGAFCVIPLSPLRISDWLQLKKVAARMAITSILWVVVYLRVGTGLGDLFPIWKNGKLLPVARQLG